jgi:hypothetical protein
MLKRLSVKQLHADTGRSVRLAGKSRTPIQITDRGQLVAVLANPNMVPGRRRQRVLLPEFEALMARPPSDDMQAALDDVRGDR